MAVRVRFAPSPTGPLHLGSAMAAVANYLFARRAGGTFVLRVDDTDAERSERGYESSIREDAEWLGLRFDEGPAVGGEHGPYRQSERAGIYAEAAARLLEQRAAYRCFCSEEDLARARLAAERTGQAFRYDGRCSRLAPEEVERRLEAGEHAAIRLRVPPGDIVIPDAVRGDIRVPGGTIGDFVIVRSSGAATYTFATAVDDHAMEISHVIRGEDHVSNTARQLFVLRALGGREPRYAHYGLLLDADGQKLSKRRGAESIAELRGGGYPPEAVVNYVALLLNPAPEGHEVASLETLAERFSLSELSSSPARFDRAKLDWLSQEHLKRLDAFDLATRVGTLLERRGVRFDPAQVAALAEALRGAHTLADAADEVQQVVRRPPPDGPSDRTAALALSIFRDVRAAWPQSYLAPAEAEQVLQEVRARAGEHGLEARELLAPVRSALTGARRGLPLHNVIAAIERDDALARTGAASDAR